jgi:hypothetical protein
MYLRPRISLFYRYRVESFSLLTSNRQFYLPRVFLKKIETSVFPPVSRSNTSSSICISNLRITCRGNIAFFIWPLNISSNVYSVQQLWIGRSNCAKQILLRMDSVRWEVGAVLLRQNIWGSYDNLRSYWSAKLFSLSTTRIQVIPQQRYSQRDVVTRYGFPPPFAQNVKAIEYAKSL